MTTRTIECAEQLQGAALYRVDRDGQWFLAPGDSARLEDAIAHGAIARMAMLADVLEDEASDEEGWDRGFVIWHNGREERLGDVG